MANFFAQRNAANKGRYNPERYLRNKRKRENGKYRASGSKYGAAWVSARRARGLDVGVGGTI